MENLPGPTSITRYFPEADADVARKSFALHIYIMIRVIEELSIDFDERHPDHALTDSERDAIRHAVALMMAEGLLEPDDAETSQVPSVGEAPE